MKFSIGQINNGGDSGGCDRLYSFYNAHVMLLQVDAANREVSHSEFVDLVKSLLKNPDEREHFFQVSAPVAP